MSAAISLVARELLAALRGVPQSTAPLRAVRKQFTRLMRTAMAREVLTAAREILPHYRWVAYELIENHPAARAAVDARLLRELGRGLASWGDVDSFGVLLAGQVWRAGQIPDAEIHRWAASRDRWWRRAALVATVPLNIRARGGLGDAPRTLEVCRRLVDDRDPMVVKALSWALRELAKRAPEEVRRFVQEHETRLASLVRREVGNKIVSGRKHPVAQTKVSAGTPRGA